MTRMTAMVAAVVVALLGVGTTAHAHHAFAAEFDANRPVRLKGVLTRIEWTNPHAWFHVEVTKPDGTVETWQVEAGSPNALFRRGITRDTMKVDVEVVVEGYQAKNGTLRANGRDISLLDGRNFFMGSAGTGAPEG